VLISYVLVLFHDGGFILDLEVLIKIILTVAKCSKQQRL